MSDRGLNWGVVAALALVISYGISYENSYGSLWGSLVARADDQLVSPESPVSTSPGSASPVLPGWQAPETIVDYREHIEKTPFGYLRWQRFPVRIAVEPVVETSGSAAAERDRRWVAAVRQAIADWQPYFPLVEVTAEAPSGDAWKMEDSEREGWDIESWDIYVFRSRPPLQRLRDGSILPARLADTRYEMLSPGSPDGTAPVKFRFRIRIGNQQGEAGLRSTARHELGHALGLWGHSPYPEDVMYPAQMGNYPPISDWDLKTLQWLYNP